MADARGGGKPALERPVRTAVPSTDENMAIAMRIMRVRGITPGSIAGRIGMSRSRAYRLMAKDSDKRTTVRVDEIDAILRDLGVDRYQLAVISELGERADASLEEDLQIAIFFSDLMTGLATELVQGLSNIHGLDLQDLDDRHRRALRQQTAERLLDRMQWLSNHRASLKARFCGEDQV